MRRRTDLSSGWTSYEVIQKDEAQSTPVSDALAAGGRIPVAAANKISIMEQIGWPSAKRDMRYGRGKPRIVKKSDVIWLLKCSPDCWRLYFYVIPNKKYIVYVHAVCKRQDVEDPADAVKAKLVYDDIQAGRSAVTPFPFPPV